MTTNPDRKVYRKRRKWQGATWTPTREAALFGDGVYCKAHRMRHGYAKGLTFNCEKRGDDWYILWGCPETGNILREDKLGEPFKSN